MGWFERAKRRTTDLIENPAATADMLVDQLRNRNAYRQPTIANGELTNRPMTQNEQNEQSLDDTGFGGGMAGITVPWLSKARIDALRNVAAYTMRDDVSKAGVGQVRPSEFLKATTLENAHIDDITAEAGRFDPFRFANQSQFPTMNLHRERPELIGHEGRHRLAALLKASGNDDPVAVMVQQGWDNKQAVDALRGLGNKRYQGQYEPSRSAQLGSVEPLTYVDPIAEQSVEVPLKNIGVSLKPMGRNVTEDDLDAYHYNSIPYGRLAPPKPRT